VTGAKELMTWSVTLAGNALHDLESGLGEDSLVAPSMDRVDNLGGERGRDARFVFHVCCMN